MRKLIVTLGLLFVSVTVFTSCENPELTDETNEFIEAQSTGQGEVGDPVDDDEEEGSN